MDDFYNVARQNMVTNQIMTTKVLDKRIWTAMTKVPRHEFVEARWRQVAYLDRELPLGNGRFLLQPEMFAQMLELAHIGEEDKVLDIGCGNGYSTAVMAELAGMVIGLESEGSLAMHAAEKLLKMGYENIAVKHSALLEGAPENALYDVIVVNGLLSKVPEALSKQLRKGGRLVALEKQGAMSKIVLYQNFGGICAIVEAMDGYASAL